MADEKEKEGVGPEKAPLREDQILARLVRGPGQAPTGLTGYIGLLRRSPNAGYWQLFLSLDMSVYIEVREEDIVHSEQLSSDKSPFGGLGGTQIYVKRGAKVTRSRTDLRTYEAGAAEDEFDLDIRLGMPAGMVTPMRLGTKIGGGPGGTCETCLTQCDDTCQGTCRTCDTCRRTCQTQCGQATCTCQTQCDTCDTCHRTCNTCRTDCGCDTGVRPC